ncbi:MAG: ribonuclease Z [Candidatus Woesearchaeota archaeon]
MRYTFLGTAAMVPTKERNHPSLLLEREGVGVLFDVGEGTQRQLRIAGIPPTRIHIICLSHWHGDHALGLMGLLQTMAASNTTHEVTLIGPVGSAEKLDMLERVYPANFTYSLRIVEASEDLIGFSGFSIRTLPVDHPVANIAFQFIEDDRRLIRTDLLEQKGIPDGPWLGKLQRGEDAEWGEHLLDVESYTKLRRGRKVSYVTDTLLVSNAIEIARDADLLVCESTFASEHTDKSVDYDHMTSEMAAQIAQRADVRRLLLTHISQRYGDVSVLRDEARAIFPESDVAFDFMTGEIPKRS